MAEPRMNALFNCKNPYQGKFPRALCLCSAGLLRSPTLAYVLSNKGYNTRAAGVHDYALIPVDQVLMKWADVVFCVEPYIEEVLSAQFDLTDKKVVVLNIPDVYAFRDEKLIEIIEKQLGEKNGI